MSRRDLRRNTEDNGFESEIFKDMEKNTEDDNGTSGSENESDEPESSENEDLLVESDEEYDGDDITTKVKKTDIDYDDEEDSGEDDAPDAVSFQSGKDSAIQKMRQMMKQIDTEKTALKNKRRQLDQQYKDQKKKKLEELSKRKLPEDFFDDLPEKTDDLKPKSSSNSKKKKVGSIEDEEEGSLADTEEEFQVSGEDFISLDSNRLSGVEVSTVQKHQQKTMSSRCRASDFRAGRLNNVPRQTSKVYFAKLEKKKALKEGLSKEFLIK